MFALSRAGSELFPIKSGRCGVIFTEGHEPWAQVHRWAQRAGIGDRMEHSTRRNFFAVTGVGTAVGIASLAAPSAADAASIDQVRVPAGAASSMAAYVSNVHRGEVTLMVSDREVTVIDKQLAARLAHAFHQAARG